VLCDKHDIEDRVGEVVDICDSTETKLPPSEVSAYYKTIVVFCGSGNGNGKDSGRAMETERKREGLDMGDGGRRTGLRRLDAERLVDGHGLSYVTRGGGAGECTLWAERVARCVVRWWWLGAVVN
jgi:hypothetical protein